MNKKTLFSSIQIIFFACYLFLLPPLAQSQVGTVTLSVGDGSGAPGSTGNPVEISLENSDDRTTGVQFDICRGSYLTLSACENTDRTSTISCSSIDLGSGCDRIIFFSFGGNFIEVGTGPIITLSYDVSPVVPLDECQDLTLEGVIIVSCVDDGAGGCTTGSPFDNVTLEEGEFCFSCIDDADCDDGVYCNGGETCDAGSGTCQPGTDPCPGQSCNEDPQGCYNPTTTTTSTAPPTTTTTTAPPTTIPTTVPTTIPTTVPTTTPTTIPTTTPTTIPTTTPTTVPTTTPTTAPSTTPTTAPSTTPTTAPTTTPTTVVPSYKVTISPSSATLDSDATLQFSAKTTDNGSEVGDNYTWNIVSGSTIGSTIDEDGLFTAGENTTGSDINETVRVTDTDHENKSATASVTVKFKEPPLPECEVKINPSAATVCSTETIAMEAETTGDEGCLTGDYEWSIDSGIESVIDQDGNYTAGINNTGSDVTDIITVVDIANFDISDSVTIKVESKIASILPGKLLGSNWIPSFHFLLITSDDAIFSPDSTISFEPEDDVLPLGHLIFGKAMLAMVILNVRPQEGAVTMIINTGGEIITGELTIGLLPFLLSEE